MMIDDFPIPNGIGRMRIGYDKELTAIDVPFKYELTKTEMKFNAI